MARTKAYATGHLAHNRDQTIAMNIHDLNEFIQAPPDAEVTVYGIVENGDESPTTVRKEDIVITDMLTGS